MTQTLEIAVSDAVKSCAKTAPLAHVLSLLTQTIAGNSRQTCEFVRHVGC
jgi:hypothetical protein